MVAPAVSKPVVRTTAPQRTWMPVRHFPVRKAEANLWFVDEDAVHVSHGRRMTIARRGDGRLILHTPICLNEAVMREVSAFGEPAWLVLPEASVAPDAAAWLARYPRCKVACPASEAAKVSALCRVDGALSDVPRDADVRLEPLAGCLSETVLLVRGSGRTSLVFSRVLVNRPPHGLWEKLLRAGAPSDGPQFNRRFRWRDVNDRKALRDHLSDLASVNNLARVVPGEGAEIAGAEAGEVLKRLAETV